jgi:hypothetical protein
MPSEKEQKDEAMAKLEIEDSAQELSIHIAVDSRGNILLETVGTSAQECDQLAGALEARLGEITRRVNKECYGKQQA